MSRFVRVTTSNMEAYQLYLKGRAMLYRRGPWIQPALESFTAGPLVRSRLCAGVGGCCRRVHAGLLWWLPPSAEHDASGARGRDTCCAGDRTSAEAHTALAYASLSLGAGLPESRARVSRGAQVEPPVHTKVAAGMGCSFFTGVCCGVRTVWPKRGAQLRSIRCLVTPCPYWRLLSAE